MNVAVVILNWNGRNFLRRFLPSVLKYSQGVQIIVADNASTDDSIEVLSKEFPDVKQILLNSNLGFAGGYNAALSNVDADYYVLLNSDVEVTPDWIRPVLELMERDKTIAACQPKILSYTDKSAFEYAGAAGGFIDKYGYPFCRGRIFNTLEKDQGQYDDEKRIFWASGACMFVRAKSFHQVHGFDASFFAHMEEIDLCWRLQNAGNSVWYCPESKVYHVGGGTLHKSNPNKTYLNFRNNLLMLYKNLPEAVSEKVLRRRKKLDLLAAIRFLASPRDSAAIRKAYRDFEEMKKGIIKQPASNPEINQTIFQKSIISEYYFRGKKLFSQLDF